MPPNPERQAKLAARREQMANDPALREAADAAGQAVLSGSGRSPEAAAAAKPRQMLPSWYAKGGQVGKVNPFGMKNSRPDFAGGGPQSNRKFNFKKGDM